MNALNQIGKQTSDLFASMTPSARILAALMLGVIVVSLGWILAAPANDAYTPLLGGGYTLDELNQMEAALGAAQLTDYNRVGRQIKVPTDQRDEYLRALSTSNALPKRWGSAIDEALAAGSVFESPERFSSRKETAEERDFAASLQRRPEIEYAAVFYDEKKAGFARKVDRVCNIHVQGPNNMPVPRSMLKKICYDASTAFAGLEPQNIMVSDNANSNYYRGTDDPHAADENPYLAAQNEFEEKYRRELLTILNHYGEIKLDVTVELDPTLVEEQEKLAYDATNAVSVQSQSSRLDTEQQRYPTGGRPGAAVNGDVAANTATSLTSGGLEQAEKKKESSESESKVTGHDITYTRRAPLIPTNTFVSVGIPESYYKKKWLYQQSLKPEAEQETEFTEAASIATMAAVETAVKSAVNSKILGVRTGQQTEPRIEVYAYSDLPLPPLPEASFAETSMVWLGKSWSTLALLAILLVSMVMMFSWIRSQGNSATDQAFAEGFGLQVPEDMGDTLEIGNQIDEDASEATSDPKSRRAPMQMTGADMKEDLSNLIKENPDAAVNLIKSWIGEAA